MIPIKISVACELFWFMLRVSTWVSTWDNSDWMDMSLFIHSHFECMEERTEDGRTEGGWRIGVGMRTATSSRLRESDWAAKSAGWRGTRSSLVSVSFFHSVGANPEASKQWAATTTKATGRQRALIFSDLDYLYSDRDLFLSPLGFCLQSALINVSFLLFPHRATSIKLWIKNPR